MEISKQDRIELYMRGIAHKRGIFEERNSDYNINVQGLVTKLYNIEERLEKLENPSH